MFSNVAHDCSSLYCVWKTEYNLNYFQKMKNMPEQYFVKPYLLQ